MQVPSRSQIVVIGGGPGGSTAACLLAREGFEVTVFEREKFPRYHIGESLLTSLMPLARFMGVAEKLDRHGFIKKPGAYFALKQGMEPGHIDFSRVASFPYTFQVIRAEFDQILLGHAVEQGARVFEETQVTSIRFDDNSEPVALTYKARNGTEGEIAFDYLVDASGLNGILATKYLKNRDYQECFANVAVGGYFADCEPYLADQPGAFFSEAIGDGRGWIWAIPLHDGTISVGAVVHRSKFSELMERFQDRAAVFRDCVERCPTIARMIKGARLTGDMRVWQDYSYCARQFSGRNFRLAGDAAGFIDPLFSTGVHMAMLGGLTAAATLSAVIRGEIAERFAADFHDTYVRRAFTRFVLLVAGAYRQIKNQDAVVLFSPRKPVDALGTPEVSGESFQMAFQAMQPILSGNMDLAREHLDPELVSEAMEYMTAAVMEAHSVETGSRVAKLLITQGLHDDFISFEPIDSHIVRLERGALGLMKIDLTDMAAQLSAFQKALAEARSLDAPPHDGV